MPKLKLSSATPTNDPRAIALVRKVTGLGVSSAAERLAIGPAGWLLTADLYEGDHADRAGECRQLIEGLQSLGLETYILYAPKSTPWETVLASKHSYEVSPVSVLQLLDEPDQEFD